MEGSRNHSIPGCDWSKPSFKNKLLGIRPTAPEGALNSSTSTSSCSTVLNGTTFNSGFVPSWQYRDRCLCPRMDCVAQSSEIMRHSIEGIDNLVDYNYIKQVKRDLSDSHRSSKGNVVSLAEGVIPGPCTQDGSLFTPTYYDGSSISVDSKSVKYGCDNMPKLDSVSSFLSMSDRSSDVTFGLGLKQNEAGSPHGRADGGGSIYSRKTSEYKMTYDPFMHDLILPMYRSWIRNDIVKYYLQDEYPALPGQEERDLSDPASGSYENSRSLESVRSTSSWSCIETNALLETVASTLRSTEELLSLVVRKITPSDACRSNKMYLFHTIKRFLISCLGEQTKVYLAGSTAYDSDIDYGQLFPIQSHSDIDIEVISPKCGYNSRAILRKVYNSLCEMQATLKDVGLVNNWVIGDSNFKLVDSARVPIIIMKTRNGVLCDISANTSNSLGHNELFMRYIDKHPILRSFMRLIKHWLKFRGIPVMKEGGFPSILWMLLFCNVVDTETFPGAAPRDLRSRLSSIFEMLYSKNIMGSAPVSPTERVAVDTKGLLSNATLLASLEKSFKVLSYGTNLIEMVNVLTSRGFAKCAGHALGTPRWYIGDICGNLISLIEMEPNVPFSTWLVYYYELYRAEEYIVKYSGYLEVLVSLLVCLRAYSALNITGNHNTYLSQLKALICNVKELLGYNLDHIIREGKTVRDNIEEHVNSVAEALNVKLVGGQMMENAHLLINQLLQKISAVSMNIFKYSLEKVYSIPASIEPPLPLIRSQEIYDVKEKNSAIPVCDGTMWNDSGWFIVALDFKLYIIKAIKVCVDWESWWSMDFVSRRDSKTVYHGFVYRQISANADRGEEPYEDDTDQPSVLLRKGGLVLFHPCDIVSRFYVMKVMKHESKINSCYYSFDMFTGARTLYVVPGFEVKRFRKFERAASIMAKKIGTSMFLSGSIPKQCLHCGAITIADTLTTSDNKPSHRKAKGLRSVLCSQWYMEHYTRMKTSLRRVESNITNVRL